MIGWLVVVFAVSGWLLVQVKRKHELATNKENGRLFDEAHSGQFLVTALLATASAELIATSPGKARKRTGFRTNRLISGRYCRSSRGPATGRAPDRRLRRGARRELGWLRLLHGDGVVTVIVRVVLRRLLGGQATQAAAKVAPGPVVSASVWRDPNAEYWGEVSDRSVAEALLTKPGSDEYGRVSKAFMLTLDRGQFTIHSIERPEYGAVRHYAPKMSSILAHGKDEEARKMVRNWLFHGC